jgi:hypothetical protein
VRVNRLPIRGASRATHWKGSDLSFPPFEPVAASADARKGERIDLTPLPPVTVLIRLLGRRVERTADCVREAAVIDEMPVLALAGL